MKGDAQRSMPDSEVLNGSGNGGRSQTPDLRVSGTNCEGASSPVSSTDSLFDGGDEGDGEDKPKCIKAASDGSDDARTASSRPLTTNAFAKPNIAAPNLHKTYTIPERGQSSTIPGLWYLPETLSPNDESSILSSISAHGYLSDRNQSMLFGRWRSCGSSGLPSWADHLVSLLSRSLSEGVDTDVWNLLFRYGEGGITTGKKRKIDEETLAVHQPTSRQLILNHYTAPEGITSHIDLPTRFGDGIIILSLSSGIGMDFTRVKDEQEVLLYLPPLSCVVLTGEARWVWKHGIRRDEADWVACGGADGDDWVMTQHTSVDESGAYYVPRGERTSVTIRWLLPGADVVGN